jgi:thiamine biosynthesis lipoprotein
MRTILKFLFATLIALWLAACGRVPLQEQQAYVFGTRVEVVVASEQPEHARQAIAAVLQEFDRMHRLYHAWQPSELTTLNSAISSGRPQKVTPELADFIREAKDFTRQGDGLFDPGIGELIALWGFQSDEFAAKLPDEAALKKWLAAKPSIADLAIDQNNIVTSRNRHVQLDFGGYLKGVALDHAASLLRQQGIKNALINIGGNVMALGDKGGRPWRVGIQHPRQPGPLATIALSDGEAIGTSGDYPRVFELDGKRYPHLLDPRTGWPASHTQAVTVLIPAGPKSGTLSDATSKPIFIAGADGWREMAKKMGVSLVLRVDADGHIFVTQALRDRLEFIGNTPDLTVVP